MLSSEIWTLKMREGIASLVDMRRQIKGKKLFIKKTAVIAAAVIIRDSAPLQMWSLLEYLQRIYHQHKFMQLVQKLVNPHPMTTKIKIIFLHSNASIFRINLFINQGVLLLSNLFQLIVRRLMTKVYSSEEISLTKRLLSNMIDIKTSRKRKKKRMVSMEKIGRWHNHPKTKGKVKILLK